MAITSELKHDLICLSHLRWNFVFQRPQHLMTRFATERRVFFFEEPLFDTHRSELIVRCDKGVYVCEPHLPASLAQCDVSVELAPMLDELRATWNITAPIVWYYTPMALKFAYHVSATAVIYDCMDELSGFAGASPDLLTLEAALLAKADLVFTGGHSLYEAKRLRHPDVHVFPSSVDVSHFRQARHSQADPGDQAAIPHPRLGFFGVIDERMDLSLIDGIATARPDWHLVMLGPCAKIDRAALPRRRNIHYLGMKQYDELPAYLSGWDVALLPFAINASTRFISPTKTPEYLAAGCPVVSTPIRDVVRPYGDQSLVAIAATPGAFVEAVEAALAPPQPDWLERVDRLLSTMSWDRTWAEMSSLIDSLVQARVGAHAPLALPASAPQIGSNALQPSGPVV